MGTCSCCPSEVEKPTNEIKFVQSSIERPGPSLRAPTPILNPSLPLVSQLPEVPLTSQPGFVSPGNVNPAITGSTVGLTTGSMAINFGAPPNRSPSYLDSSCFHVYYNDLLGKGGFGQVFLDKIK